MRISEHLSTKKDLSKADAAQVKEWLSEAEEALRQVAIADVLLINKIDTVSEAELSSVKGVLKGVNPNSRVFACQQGAFPVEEILAIGTTKPETVEVSLPTYHPNPSENPLRNLVHHRSHSKPEFQMQG